MVGDRVQGGLGHGVDHVRCDQAGHVPGVLVCGVLTLVEAHSGRCGRAPACSSDRYRSADIACS